MSITKVHGVNIAVKNLESARENYERLLNVVPEPLGEKDFSFPNLVGYAFDVNGFVINIISSKTDDTSIASFLDKRGEGIFLLSLEVEDCEKSMQTIKENNENAKFILETPAATEKYRANFIHPKSFTGVQLELLEKVK